MGGVFHATKIISVFANHADNNGRPAPNGRVLPDKTLPPPTEGITDDAGFMLNLLDGKVFVRATAYRTRETNVTNGGLSPQPGGIAIPNRDILDTLLANGRIAQDEYDLHEINTGGNIVGMADTVSRGYELSLAVNPTRSLTGLLSFSYTDSKRSNLVPEFEGWYERESAFWHRTAGAGTLANAASGVSIDGNAAIIVSNMAVFRDALSFGYGKRPYKATATGRYTFVEGRLKGTFVGGGLRWQSKALIGREIVGVDAVGNTRFGGTYYGSDDFKADAFLGYRRKVAMGRRNAELTFQLNVTNLTDEAIVQPLRYNNFRSGYSRVLLNAPRQFKLSTILTF